VVASAVLLLPMMYICIELMGAPQIPLMAGVITTMCFICLTAFVFTTRVDLSSWGKYITIAFVVMICALVAGMITGFSSIFALGFCAVMVLLSCASILHNTSKVLHQYHTSQYVAASLTLFASVFLLFWYVLQILMFSNSD
jgi:FtsH-binding integral membrane protein